jgi:hypothetical protein
MALRGRMTTAVRTLVSRPARRVYLAVLVLLLLFTAGARIRGALLAREIHAALLQLENVRVDQTTEAELLKALPKLTKQIEWGGIRTYSMEVSNWPGHGWLVNPFTAKSAAWYPGPGEPCAKPISRHIAFWLGHGYALLRITFAVLDGRVSSTGYRLVLESPSCLVGFTVTSIHGRSAIGHFPVPVSSLLDQSPDFAVRAAGEFLHVTYAFDAPRERVARAFQLDLGCLWNLTGRSSHQEVAPALWQDKTAVEAAAVSRLSSWRKPCPDELLAGRVRYLPDLNIELLEVIRSRSDAIKTYEGDTADFNVVNDYRVIEVIRGQSVVPMTGMAHRNLIPAPLFFGQHFQNPVPPPRQPGERVLYFSGANFESCRMVRATSSALSAVRAAIPAPKRIEDDLFSGFGRM